MLENVTTTLLSTPVQIKTFLNELGDVSGSPPSLYIDAEGDNLCRHGTLSVLTICVEPRHKVYLVDVTTLQDTAFSTPGSNGFTLKQILESAYLLKVFFDVRNDSDALFSLHGIELAGVQDLQLTELSTRNWYARTHLASLATCIKFHAGLNSKDQSEWQAVKSLGRTLFAPERGGSYSVFDERPLSEDITKYCAQDVTLMPQLYHTYSGQMGDLEWRLVQEESRNRVASSQTPGYSPSGRHKCLGPSSWRDSRLTTSWRYVIWTRYTSKRPQPKPRPASAAQINSNCWQNCPKMIKQM